MKIDYEAKSNKFLMKCGFGENGLIANLPDKRFRKNTAIWAVPVLRRNIQAMGQSLNKQEYYTADAWSLFKSKLDEFTDKPTGGRDFPAWYQFKNPPKDYQFKTLKKMYPLDEAAILFEQGLGKTFTSINLVTAWRLTNQIDSVVVICPSSIKLVWQIELDLHCPIPTQRHVIESGKPKPTEKFIQERDDFQWLFVGVEGLSQGNAIEHVKRFMAGRKVAIIIDESSTIKTPNKIRTDNCIDLRPLSKKRIILSGTFITQGAEDFYTQYKFLNPDIIGYHSFFSYRAQYCVTIPIEVAEDRFIQKIVGYKNMEELVDTIMPCTVREEKKDNLDLPEKIYMDRYITMNPTQKKLYNEMKHELAVTLDGVEYEVTSILEQTLRLQQITGGHYPFDDGEQVIAKPIPGRNPKIEELMNVLDEYPGKAVIWCQFRPEIALVAENLGKAGISFVEFHGGCDDGAKASAVDRFMKDDSARVFLATRAAARGLTLTAASTSIYYSQGPSLDQYLQSQDRVHRIGQKNTCNYVHLLCDKTVDTAVMKSLQGKGNIAELFYNMMKEKN